jgi:hypothetical protein
VIYSQGYARRSLLGQPSVNPSIAAKSLLGRERVYHAKRKIVRRRAHPGNPAPALVGALTSLVPGIGKLFKKPSEQRAAALAPALVAQANAGNLTAAKGIIERAAIPMKAAESAVWRTAAAQIAPAIVQAVRTQAARIPAASQRNPEEFAASIMASPVQIAGAAPAAMGAAPAPGALPTIAGSLAVPVIRELTKKGRAPARGRYPTYVDRYGRQRYSTKPPGTELRIPQGATPTPGTPYSFFRGAVGGGGAAATAGQVAVAAAAGVASYLVTQRLLQHLGGRAQSKEEAGVNAALAFRQARADFKAQRGRDPNANELAEMKQAYEAQLLELGYDPVTFTRQRSGLERFLETYNPLGG